jgi:hypothetical protein
MPERRPDADVFNGNKHPQPLDDLQETHWPHAIPCRGEQRQQGADSGCRELEDPGSLHGIDHVPLVDGVSFDMRVGGHVEPVPVLVAIGVPAIPSSPLSA